MNNLHHDCTLKIEKLENQIIQRLFRNNKTKGLNRIAKIG
jgi:hypothetical protein